MRLFVLPLELLQHPVNILADFLRLLLGLLLLHQQFVPVFLLLGARLLEQLQASAALLPRPLAAAAATATAASSSAATSSVLYEHTVGTCVSAAVLPGREPRRVPRAHRAAAANAAAA